MKSQKKIHFQLSERKILLRVFDVLFVLLGLFGVGELFDFDYFKFSTEKWAWIIFLTFYLLFFGSVLELYNIYKASKFDYSLRGIIITASLTVLFFLLTPYYTPVLPENRLQILYFYLAVMGSLILWRFSYSYFIKSPIFVKKVLLISEGKAIQDIVSTLQKSDPNYRIVAFINVTKKEREFENLMNVSSLDSEVVKKLKLSEVLITSSGAKKIPKEVYDDLLHLRKEGITVKN
ncbi:MAG: hypothetical protein HRT68_06785 [Flavobacteriaceae bacterium]|nr:hypothetical protein [Flavobacteriaceae bacterium]